MKVSENISLLGMNSFGVDGKAARLVEWDTADEPGLIFGGSLASERWMALGGGNNVLFTGDFDGTLVRSAMRTIEITGRSAETVRVRAGAGVDWNDMVAWSIDRDLWGAENLSGIPGTVGAAPIQNIGAYGVEAKEIITSVDYFDVQAGTIRTLAAKECGFGYRDSIFKRELRGRAIVVAVDFEFSTLARPNLTYTALNAAEPTPRGISRAVVDIRNSKLPDPRVTGNGGSFFKNPVVETALADRLATLHPEMPRYPAAEPGMAKLSAGWLIEQAGWKGRTRGRAGVHSGQALIIINTGGATGSEIVDFAREVQDDVRKKFGVELTPEVNIIC